MGGGGVSRINQAQPQLPLATRGQGHRAEAGARLAGAQHQVEALAPQGFALRPIEPGHLNGAAEPDRTAGPLAKLQAALGLVALEGRFQGQLQAHGPARVVAQRQAQVVFDAVVAMGCPGRAGVGGLELRRLHLAGAMAAPHQGADRPGDRRPAHRQPGLARIGDLAPPEAADLDPTDPGIGEGARYAPGRSGELLGTGGAIEQGLPHLRRWRLVAADAGQGGQADGAAALEPQLQVEAIEQGAEALHRDRQHQQGRELAGRQGPALGQLGTGLLAEQFGGDPIPRSGVGAAVLGQQGGQGQKRRRSLAGPSGLGQGGGSGNQPQLHRRRLARHRHHRQPEGGFQGLGRAGVHVVAEQVEPAVQGQVEVGIGEGPALALEGGQQDPGLENQLRVVVIDHQHRIQPPRQGRHLLGPQHRCGSGRTSR